MNNISFHDQSSYKPKKAIKSDKKGFYLFIHIGTRFDYDYVVNTKESNRKTKEFTVDVHKLHRGRMNHETAGNNPQNKKKIMMEIP